MIIEFKFSSSHISGFKNMTNPFENAADDNYNPFAQPAEYESVNSYNGGGSVETIQQTDNTPGYNYDYPSYQQNNSYNVSGSNNSNAGTTFDAEKNAFKDPITNLTITEKDIIEKEKALSSREEIIANREREVVDARANGTLDQLNPHRRNYPPFLNLYKFYPDEDIPEEQRPYLMKIYWLEYASIGALFLNAIGCIASLSASNTVASPSANIVFGIIYLLIGSYLSMDLCVMTLYNSLMLSKAMRFIGFMVAYAAWIIFLAFIAIGFNDFGSVGWITAIDTLAENKGFAGYCFVVSIAFTGLIAVHCWAWYLGYKVFKQTDFKKRAIGEAAGWAAKFASDHKDEIAAARDNPEVAAQAASFAAQSFN